MDISSLDTDVKCSGHVDEPCCLWYNMPLLDSCMQVKDQLPVSNCSCAWKEGALRRGILEEIRAILVASSYYGNGW
jgi:hypothetical protein